ncbi:MAG: glycosyltransferase, partial [Deltaproteobacteria bacterium]|nr:glycosyltransferase [Deltaproteobacteria bacterium]
MLATYNQPMFLVWVLITLARQSVGDFEVVVADDGSTEETKRLLERLAPRFPGGIQHVWQEDRGFRKCLALNRAVHRTRSDYLIFTDGDCLLHRHFVRAHRELARSDRFLIGRMPRLGPKITASIRIPDLESGRAQRLTLDKLWDGLFGESTKIEFGIYVPVRWAFDLVRKTKKRLDLWGGNFSCSKADFVAVNGFNN